MQPNGNISYMNMNPKIPDFDTNKNLICVGLNRDLIANGKYRKRNVSYYYINTRRTLEILKSTYICEYQILLII